MFQNKGDIKWLLKSSFFVAVVLIILYACANPGTPTGGPVDITPPRVVGSTPAPLSVKVTKNKIVIDFDEFIKLEKANEKVVISPPQVQQAEIKTSGKKIIVNLLDSLKPNSTYTVDFSDAIQDNNEGNPLGNYTFTFSTGSVIDTMEVSGTVLNAADLEPVKGILVGLHSNLNDSVFLKTPFDRVGRTDSRGHFYIRGISPGKYRIFALMDADQNFVFSQKSEQYAFNDSLVIPKSDRRMRQDTTWIDSLTIDTIVSRQYTHYYPDNIILRAFKENNEKQSLLKSERLTPQKFTLYFTAPNKDLPKIKGLNFDEKDAYIVEPSLKKDTINYWLKDSLNYKKDTLSLALSYYYTDSLNRLLPRTDTLNLRTKQKLTTKQTVQKKKKKKEPEIKPTLPMDKHIPQTMDVYDCISFGFEEPIKSYDIKAFHLKEKVDSTYKDLKFDFVPDSVRPRRYNLYYDWVPDKEYEIEVDSAAFCGQYGLVSEKVKQDFKVHKLDDYGDIYFDISGAGAGPKAFVELLDASDKVVRKMPVRNGRANFYFLGAGKYCARLIEDTNGNGIWDTGDYSKHIQPEKVFYYPQILELKVMWKLEKNWNVSATPWDKQKPNEMKKQKPDEDKKKKTQNQNQNQNRNNNYNNRQSNFIPTGSGTAIAN
jgi:hypothetical protein